MAIDAEFLMAGFASATEVAGREPIIVTHEQQLAPHQPHSLPAETAAVYVFSLSDSYGATCPAGRGRALKVDKVGPGSDQRFRHHHYNPRSSGSNVAKSLLEVPVLWPYLGIRQLSELEVASWIRANTDRDNFFVRQEHVADLERYMRGLLGPAFEGG